MENSANIPADPNVDVLHAREWSTPPGVAASALFPEPLGCGIYVLSFANGEKYVGQTNNFMRRFSSHRRRWSDISSISFIPADASQLVELERRIIQQHASAGVLLRNLTLHSQPLGSSPFDLIVDRQEQAEWLDADINDRSVSVAELRPALARRRISSRSRFDELRNHSNYEEILDSLAYYVAEVIPWADTTEGHLWTVTALPSTSRRRGHRRLVTLNIQNLEVLFLGEELDAEGQWVGYTAMNTAFMDPVPKQVERATYEIDSYKSAGTVHRVEVDGLDVVGELLTIPELRRAARSLALGQLRKGKGTFTRHHNDALGDEIFARIGDLLDSASSEEDPTEPHGSEQRLL